MSVNYKQATDEMYGMAQATLAGVTVTALLGYTMDIRYPGVPKALKPDVTRHWSRVSRQLVIDAQSSLSNVNGVKSYEAIGLLYVQLFCPRNLAGSIETGTAVALQLQAAYRQQSPSGEIWFTRQEIRELPETSDSYPINFVTRFSYKTIQ